VLVNFQGQTIVLIQNIRFKFFLARIKYELHNVRKTNFKYNIKEDN